MKKTIIIPALALASLLGGCGGESKTTPPKELVINKISLDLPRYLKIDSIELDTGIPQGDNFISNCKITIEIKEDLFSISQMRGQDGPMNLLKQINSANSRVTIYGKVKSQHQVDRWDIKDINIENDGQTKIGKPRTSFDDSFYIANSPEAAAAVKKIEAEEKAKLERQASERKAAAEKQAKIEAEEKAKIEGKKQQIITACALGKTFKGRMMFDGKPQDITMVFTTANAELNVEAIVTEIKTGRKRQFVGNIYPNPNMRDYDITKRFNISLQGMETNFGGRVGENALFINEKVSICLNIDDNGKPAGYWGDYAGPTERKTFELSTPTN